MSTLFILLLIAAIFVGIIMVIYGARNKQRGNYRDENDDWSNGSDLSGGDTYTDYGTAAEHHHGHDSAGGHHSGHDGGGGFWGGHDGGGHGAGDSGGGHGGDGGGFGGDGGGGDGGGGDGGGGGD